MKKQDKYKWKKRNVLLMYVNVCTRRSPDHKKIQKEDLQLRLTMQKEELEREFAAEREELETDYQKQVDDMFFFGYRCCMKKNGIKRDVPSIPPGEEKKLLDKPAPW